MNTARLAAAGAAAFAALLAAAPAAAQERREHIWAVGIGPQVYPEYPGADGYAIGPMPFFARRRAGDPMPFKAQDDGISLRLIEGPFEIGPVLQFQPGRRPEDVGAPVERVGFTLEPGGYAQLWLGRGLRLRGEARRGIGGHEGWVGDVGADLVARDGTRAVYSIGPRLRWSDSRYQNAYFGVTPAASAAAGLPAYRASGGVHAVGAMAGATVELSRSWGLYGYAGYDRLIGDAGDSPLVRRFGARDQLSGGIGLFYQFRRPARR
jgi:MipA family protein